jgi:EAL domain-containing protein (putative c-di-GMP-specific phosphodiesterase class I)/ActR/RegA family two-component response regulator
MQSMEQADGPDGGRILVVDDEEGLRAAYARILTAGGFRVDSCESAEGVLERLRAGERYLVIVTDLVMAGMDGIELLRAVRKFDPEVPVIILTGHPSLHSTIAAVEHHSFRYLVKPVTPLLLGETVRAAAAMYRLTLLKRRALEICENDGWRTDAGSLAECFDSALGKLFMVYQPIVPLAGPAIGFEALVRTGEPALGSPDKLFDAAERLGRVPELGRTIRQLVSAEIAGAPDGTLLFVNLHASDLGDTELYSPDAALSRHARRVVLEITERKSLDGVIDVKGRLADLRKLGYQIAVDDLGAGYAGLSCFAALEPDIVKLDMSLIRDIDSSARKRALVESMIRVCQVDLGIQVVCEGVETRGELDTLASVGASLLQGYLFARPQRGFHSHTQVDLHSEQRLIASESIGPPQTKLG